MFLHLFPNIQSYVKYRTKANQIKNKIKHTHKPGDLPASYRRKKSKHRGQTILLKQTSHPLYHLLSYYKRSNSFRITFHDLKTPDPQKKKKKKKKKKEFEIEK